MKKTTRGFTLIELLVVIAIIGILSSVVLASLNSARSKGADAAIKENLNNIRAQAEIVYDTANGNYTGVCADPNVVAGVKAASAAAGGTWATVANNVAGTACVSSQTAWVAFTPLKTANWWCVDSTGKAKMETAALAATATACTP